jgi:hypothetical protein
LGNINVSMKSILKTLNEKWKINLTYSFGLV